MAYKVSYKKPKFRNGKKSYVNETASIPTKTGKFGANSFKKHLQEVGAKNIQIRKIGSGKWKRNLFNLKGTNKNGKPHIKKVYSSVKTKTDGSRFFSLSKIKGALK